MKVPPEVLLDRYLRNELSSELRERYKGKQDLSQLPKEFGEMLELIQRHENDTFASQQNRVHAPGRTLGLHFDYIDAIEINALAFQYESFAFICLTLPLVQVLRNTCELLSLSNTAALLLGCSVGSQEEQRNVFTALFGLQHQFVSCHELGHHFHGHTYNPEDPTKLREEFRPRGPASAAGRLRDQAMELDADGFAVNMVLSNIFTGPPRLKTLELLGRSGENPTDEDILLSSFLLSVGAFFFACQPMDFDDTSIYQLTHPPKLARMNFIMYELIAWCKRVRPELISWGSTDRFSLLMDAVEETIGSRPGGKDWHQQGDYLQSAHGTLYGKRLVERRVSLREEMDQFQWKLLPEEAS